MVQLSHDISGIILPHDYFGNHLNASGKTKDINLEERNFFKAAEVLAEVWLNTVIDGHKIEAKALPVELEYELIDAKGQEDMCNSHSTPFK